MIQFDGETYTPKILSDLNDLCIEHGEGLCIRFYGHYSSSFDCKTVLQIPDVKALRIDCLLRADNVESLTSLSHLRELSLGIYELKETEILSSDNFKKLHRLIISEIKTKAFNLDYLRYYKELQSLIICSQSKNIEAVGELGNLESLSLNSLKKTSISFINNLKKLKKLIFMLGGRDNIHEIQENEIEDLEIVWVRGFNDISNISKFHKLKTLKIEDQIQLPEIKFDAVLSELREVKIGNCKTLSSVAGLKNLPRLDTLVIYQTNVEFDLFLKQELPGTLKTLSFYTRKSKQDGQIKKILLEKGYYCR